jgi:hypothetical protein
VQAYEYRAEKKELSREFHEVFDRNGDGVLELDEIIDLFSPSQYGTLLFLATGPPNIGDGFRGQAAIGDGVR